MNRASLIIAAYNAQDTIAHAIASALAQTELEEVIVVDDASSDATLARARACDDGSGRLSILAQPHNQGPAAARNIGLHLARADWVGVLDADDYLLPNRLRSMLAASAGYDIIADDLLRSKAQSSSPPAPAWALGSAHDVSLDDFVRANISEWRKDVLELGFAKPLMRTSFLRQNGLCYDASLRLGEDFDFYARALARGARMRLIPAAGYVSVESEGSLSKNHSPDDLAALLAASRRLSQTPHLNAATRALLKRHATSVDKRLQWRRLIEAVKARDLSAGAATFRSPEVALHLLGCLCEQAWLRSLQPRTP